MSDQDWTGVALEGEIRPGTSQAATVFGRSVAIWRTAEGLIQVWENRCPHRGMPLSFGFVDGPLVRCLYHGWSFNADSRCTYIPAHPDLTPPPTIRATAYQNVVRYGIVWANLALEPVSDLPVLADDPDFRAIRSVTIEASAEQAIDLLINAFDGPTTLVQTGTSALRMQHNGIPLLGAIRALEPRRTVLHVTAASRALTDLHRHDLARRFASLRDVQRAA